MFTIITILIIIKIKLLIFYFTTFNKIKVIKKNF